MKKLFSMLVCVGMLWPWMVGAENVAPTVVIHSAEMRQGTTYMDVHFRVNDPDHETVT